MVGRVRTDVPEAERPKLAALTVALVRIIFFLAGCGSQTGKEPSDHPARQQRAATNEEPSSSEPPESTLSFTDQTVTGELGSYCWSSGSPATCADAAGIPVAREQQTLTVPVDSELMFDYSGQGTPDSVEARAYPLKQEKQWLPGPEGTRLMRPKGDARCWRRRISESAEKWTIGRPSLPS
jgi:hypothetical protein